MITERYHLEYLRVSSGTDIVPTATMKLKYKNKMIESTSTGDGPVDACYKAIDKAVGVKGKLINYSLRAITGGKDALGDVSVKIEAKGEVISGRGSSTDIIEASAKAYLNAINRLMHKISR